MTYEIGTTFRVFFQTEATTENFTFETLKEARAKIKAIHTNEDLENIVLLNLWADFEGFDEGINTKFSVNRLDEER